MFSLYKFAISQAMKPSQPTLLTSNGEWLHVILREGFISTPTGTKLCNGCMEGELGTACILCDRTDDRVLSQQGAQRGMPIGGSRAGNEGIIGRARGPTDTQNPVIRLLEGPAKVNGLDPRN